MKQIRENRKAYFRTLTLLYFAMLVGQVAFLFVMWHLKKSGGDYQAKHYEVVEYLNFLVPFFAVASIIASPILYKWQLDMARKRENIEKKLSGYLRSFLVRMAVLESIVIFGGVGYLLTNTGLYFVYVGVLLIFEIAARPTAENVIEALKLNEEERLLIMKE